MDVFPGFWDWIEAQNENRIIASTHSIREELTAGNDDLSIWTKDLNKSNFFLPDDDEQTQIYFGQIVNWAQENDHFKPTAKEELLRGADPLLIAKAKSHGSIIVTQEKSDPQSKKKIFIPDVCNHFNVPYIDTVGMLRKIGGRF